MFTVHVMLTETESLTNLDHPASPSVLVTTITLCRQREWIGMIKQLESPSGGQNGTIT